MSAEITDQYAAEIVRELRGLPAETEWAEFKVDNEDPERIGQYVSALSNSAAIAGKSSGYLVWGVEDKTHAVVGTSFSPSNKKVGGEVFENWLLRSLAPKVSFQFKEITVEDKPVVLLAIERAFRNAVRFKSEAYIRVGSSLKNLKDADSKERDLWRALDETPFEMGIAAERVSDEQVVQLLDYPPYFDLLGLPLPETRSGIIKAFADDELIVRNDGGSWDVTNMGAVLFARKLSGFGSLGRKGMRVIEYKGKSNVETVKEQKGTRGYATGFKGLIGYINSRLPSNEVIGQALRTEVPMYPELAVRELVANALIHQDYFETGTGPMVEIYEDRIEITNPGRPLIATDRFLNTPPKSRNESLASLMRRMGICEERGTGIDKVVSQTEFYQLPAPIFEVVGDNTRAVLLSPRPLTEMDRDDRIRACYLHACLRYAQRDYLTNTSLRERFGIEQRNSATASRLIKEAVEAKAIAPYDETAAKRLMKYVPIWAAASI